MSEKTLSILGVIKKKIENIDRNTKTNAQDLSNEFNYNPIQVDNNESNSENNQENSIDENINQANEADGVDENDNFSIELPGSKTTDSSSQDGNENIKISFNVDIEYDNIVEEAEDVLGDEDLDGGQSFLSISPSIQTEFEQENNPENHVDSKPLEFSLNDDNESSEKKEDTLAINTNLDIKIEIPIELNNNVDQKNNSLYSKISSEKSGSKDTSSDTIKIDIDLQNQTNSQTPNVLVDNKTDQKIPEISIDLNSTKPEPEKQPTDLNIQSEIKPTENKLDQKIPEISIDLNSNKPESDNQFAFKDSGNSIPSSPLNSLGNLGKNLNENEEIKFDFNFSDKGSSNNLSINIAESQEKKEAQDFQENKTDDLSISSDQKSGLNTTDSNQEIAFKFEKELFSKLKTSNTNNEPSSVEKNSLDVNNTDSPKEPNNSNNTSDDSLTFQDENDALKIASDKIFGSTELSSTLPNDSIISSSINDTLSPSIDQTVKEEKFDDFEFDQPKIDLADDNPKDNNNINESNKISLDNQNLTSISNDSSLPNDQSTAQEKFDDFEFDQPKIDLDDANVKDNHDINESDKIILDNQNLTSISNDSSLPNDQSITQEKFDDFEFDQPKEELNFETNSNEDKLDSYQDPSSIDQQDLIFSNDLNDKLNANTNDKSLEPDISNQNHVSTSIKEQNQVNILEEDKTDNSSLDLDFNVDSNTDQSNSLSFKESDDFNFDQILNENDRSNPDKQIQQDQNNIPDHQAINKNSHSYNQETRNFGIEDFVDDNLKINAENYDVSEDQDEANHDVDNDQEIRNHHGFNHNLTKLLVSEDVIMKTNESLNKLIEAKELVNGISAFMDSDYPIEIAIQLMEPKLEQWLNDNLGNIVEKIIREEIIKIIHK